MVLMFTPRAAEKCIGDGMAVVAEEDDVPVVLLNYYSRIIYYGKRRRGRRKTMKGVWKPKEAPGLLHATFKF